MDAQKLDELEKKLDDAYAHFLKVSGAMVQGTSVGLVLKDELEKAYRDFCDFLAEIELLNKEVGEASREVSLKQTEQKLNEVRKALGLS